MGTKEQPLTSNRGEFIDDWNEVFNLSAVPWCASEKSYFNLKGFVEPEVKSARARDFAVEGRIWTAKQIMLDKYTPKPGDYLVKSRRGGHHVDTFAEWDTLKKRGILVGGNVNDRIMLRNVTLKEIVLWGATVTEVNGFYNYEVVNE